MPTTTDDLRRLHERYTHKVNSAAADERWDLVEELSDAFLAESLAVMAAAAT